jgi:hypothetical protein
MQQATLLETDKRNRELTKLKKDNDILRAVVKGGSEGQRCASKRSLWGAIHRNCQACCRGERHAAR